MDLIRLVLYVKLNLYLILKNSNTTLLGYLFCIRTHHKINIVQFWFFIPTNTMCTYYCCKINFHKFDLQHFDVVNYNKIN